jgi:predicted glycoside hydrolase/deacetylase ChbG (UPF0249 family)
MKLLIINADDFGYDADTFTVTKSLMDKRIVQSATIMVGYPCSEDAIGYARRHMDEMSFGLHFNIAEGRPIGRQVPASLIGSDGKFRGPIQQRLRALAGLLDPQDIADEAEAQLSILADSGLAMTHFDSHGHFHKFPHVLKAVHPVLKRFRINRVRLPQTQYDRPTLYNNWLDTYCRRRMPTDFLTPSGFFNGRDQSPTWLSAFLSNLPMELMELGVHPGTKEDWRKSEAEPLLSDTLLPMIEALKITLTSYHSVGK